MLPARTGRISGEATRPVNTQQFRRSADNELLSLKTSILLVAGITTAFVAAPAALAHEGRDVGELSFVVGFAEESALEGQPNAVSLRVSRSEEAEERADEPDLEGHGAIFSSPILEPGDRFSYVVDIELAGFTVPIHSHLDPDAHGSMAVVSQGGETGTVDIEIHAGAMHPHEISVAPGATLMWVNEDEKSQAVASGLHDAAGHTHGTAPVEGLEESLQVEVTHVVSDRAASFQLAPKFVEPGLYQSLFIQTSPGKYRIRFIGDVDGVPVDETFESGPNTFAEVAAVGDVQIPVKVASLRKLEGVARSTRDAAVAVGDDAGLARSVAIVAIGAGGVGIAPGATGLWFGLRKDRRN